MDLDLKNSQGESIDVSQYVNEIEYQSNKMGKYLKESGDLLKKAFDLCTKCHGEMCVDCRMCEVRSSMISYVKDFYNASEDLSLMSQMAESYSEYMKTTYERIHYHRIEKLKADKKSLEQKCRKYRGKYLNSQKLLDFIKGIYGADVFNTLVKQFKEG